MGQIVGKMPEMWHDLMEEKDRVLHWSSEVLAKVQDNVTNEDTFLIDYDDNKIDVKINTWIQTNQKHVDEMFSKFPNAPDQLKNVIKTEIEKITEDLQTKMQNSYKDAYNAIKKFNKKVDQLGADERKIHADIQNLAEECAGDVQKFKKKFGPLRMKVFNNLKTAEKMIFQDKKLKTDFIKNVYNIDHKNFADCMKRFDKLIKDFEKRATNQET